MSGSAGSSHTNKELFERACRVIPGGVNSPVRAFKSVGGVPFFVSRGKGAYLFDEEGKGYIDYIQSYGAVILGHADDRITTAIDHAALSGSTFGAPTLSEIILAEMIVDRVEGCDMVRLTSSGTEAAMSAIRLARGFTRRDKVLKFDGCYHGHSDALLVGGGSGIASLGIPDSIGIPRDAVSNTIVAPYNEIPPIDDSYAAVIVEPVAANMGLVPPNAGFLEELRRLCSENGVVLIFDEVITGFRISSGGASEYFGVIPDLWCFGKVIGGGLPIGAFAGRQEIMELLAPVGPVYQAGTLSGNPLATAAGVTVLSLLDESMYHRLASTAERLAQGLNDALTNSGIEAHVPRVSSLVGLFFGSETVTNYTSAKKSVSIGLYPKFFRGMLNRGVALAPGPYEAIFPSLSHTQIEVDRTIEAAAEAANLLIDRGAVNC
ncbi:MAG: glutamate-1-semialdehyde 2,1-aminomutase [Acidimicrobiaceae bacterium]|nr:glutamate-1-semialdehyde 2,1-aminomutase [Acidimicrobiaceae bacterium]